MISVQDCMESLLQLTDKRYQSETMVIISTGRSVYPTTYGTVLVNNRDYTSCNSRRRFYNPLKNLYLNMYLYDTSLQIIDYCLLVSVISSSLAELSQLESSSLENFGVCHSPVNFRAHSHSLPHTTAHCRSLPLTPTCTDARISTGE